MDDLVAPKNRSSRKKGKRTDGRPARKRYWASGRLDFRKIRNLVKYCRMSPKKAIALWEKTRKRRPRVLLALSATQLKTLESVYERMRVKRSA